MKADVQEKDRYHGSNNYQNSKEENMKNSIGTLGGKLNSDIRKENDLQNVQKVSITLKAVGTECLEAVPLSFWW